jgi:colanic acid/amylovoran biosynthesis protein
MGAALDTGNMGVSALAASFIHLVRKIRPDAHISFFIGNESSEPQRIVKCGEVEEFETINYRLSPKADFRRHLFWIFAMACLRRLMPYQSIKTRIINANPCLKSLNEADFIGDIHGGDSFSDIYGVTRFLLGSLENIIVLILGKRLVLLPQTYGPYRSYIAKRVANFIINRATCILSRDIESIELINSMQGARAPSNAVAFCPDVAFAMDFVKPDIIRIAPPMFLDQGIPVIGLNVNGLLYNGGYTRNNMFGLRFSYKLFVQVLAERIMEKTTAKLLLIPHTFAPHGHVESDPDACRDVLTLVPNAYKDRIHLISEEYDQFAIKGIIGLCDFFVGSRMHACIGALSQGIPTIAVAYSKKFLGVFNSIGEGNMVIDARTVDIETALQNICNAFQERECLKEVTRKKVEGVNAQLFNTFQHVLQS